MSRISVIIPLHNDPVRLPRAVASALGQDALGEIIIVDDASTDDSMEVATDLAERHPSIKVIQSEGNVGPAAARNQGARQARHEYLAFLDSDDEFMDGFLGDMAEYLDAHMEIQAVKVGVEFQDPVKGNVLPDYDPRYAAVVFSAAWNIVMRRDAFIAIGGFPEDSAFRTPLGGEDVAFSSAVAKYLPPLAKIDKVYYRCWNRPGSHLDRFLCHTRLADNKDGFEFVSPRPEQMPGGALEKAIDAYFAVIAGRLANGQVTT